MRNPDHEMIQVIVGAEAADRIEREFAPYFELVILPDELQSDQEDDMPVYMLGLTEAGVELMRSQA